MQNTTADSDRYSLVFDRDPQTATQIAALTGIAARHVVDPSAVEIDGESMPAAVFIDQQLCSNEDSEEEPLVMRFKDLWPATPIFVVVQGAETCVAEALALGADDFVEKPFREGANLGRRVSTRMAALARKAARETVRVGDMVIDTMQRSVSSPRGQKFLSPTEIRLVVELAKAHGSVVHRDTLKTRCWPSSNVSDNALNRKLYEIRRRLKPLSDAINIRTVYGVGFVMEEKRGA